MRDWELDGSMNGRRAIGRGRCVGLKRLDLGIL
jgi:hypothetical protein